jgi:Arabinose efflux permease
MKKSLLPLALGTFGLGISEFVMMGILPFVSRDLGVSIPEAGHLISAYALGVSVGAPVMLLGARKFSLKKVLFLLIFIYALGNALTGLSGGYSIMLAMRFVSGLPHGAFFGVGSIVAKRIAQEGKSAQALAFMISGMTVANLLGVPLGAYITNHYSWRIIFYGTGIWGVLNLLALVKFLPSQPPVPDTGLKGQFRFMKNIEPWLILIATGLGSGGVFCYYSYIAPLMTGLSGFTTADMTWIMVLSGCSMVVGNLIGGKLSDRFRSSAIVCLGYSIAALALMTVFFYARHSMISLSMMCVSSFCLFGVASAVQLLILQNARGGEMMGAAFIQIAFNMGNALGAYSGGLPIDLGMSVNYSAIIGTVFLSVAAMAVFIFMRKQQMEERLEYVTV